MLDYKVEEVLDRLTKATQLKKLKYLYISPMYVTVTSVLHNAPDADFEYKEDVNLTIAGVHYL